VKCSNHFGAKRRGLLKVNIVLAPKGAIQNFIKNIRYDTTISMTLKVESLCRHLRYPHGIDKLQ
jgi:hypothetical protein